MPMIETPAVSISESIRPVQKRPPWKKLVFPIFDDLAMDCKSGIQAVLAPSMPSHAVKQNVCVRRLVGQHPRLDHQHPRFGNSSHRIDAKHRRLVDFAATEGPAQCDRYVLLHIAPGTQSIGYAQGIPNVSQQDPPSDVPVVRSFEADFRRDNERLPKKSGQKTDRCIIGDTVVRRPSH